MRQVCLAGAGYIAGVHAEALRAIPSVRLAAAFGTAAHTPAEKVLAAGAIGAAHVLVPPDLQCGDSRTAAFVARAIAVHAR